MFLDWKNQYCENDYTTQSNLQIQCNPYQTTNGIFHRTRRKNFTICMETQKTPNSQSNLFFKIFIYLFIYLWLCWVFVSVQGLPPVVASVGHSSSRCTGLSLSRPLLLRSTGSRRAGSAIMAHGPSCSTACGIFPDQGSNPCPLHWQADSQPLRHQGSPQSNLEKGKWSWRNQTPGLQTILQSYSHQDSMVLAQKQKYRSMGQDRKSRDKPTHLWSPYF